ncbi:MAG: glutamate--tRNA ligase family protein, partial [Polyangiaceae bacterium]
GVPLYNFGCVVDDITMGVNLVARGRDHMINTPIQVLLYQALEHDVPKFAHLPMMLGKGGAKLSKRHGAVSVGEYRDQGFSPAALLNYLVRFGFVRRRGDLLAPGSDHQVRLGAVQQERRSLRSGQAARDQLRAPQGAQARE